MVEDELARLAGRDDRGRDRSVRREDEHAARRSRPGSHCRQSARPRPGDSDACRGPMSVARSAGKTWSALTWPPAVEPTITKRSSRATRKQRDPMALILRTPSARPPKPTAGHVQWVPFYAFRGAAYWTLAYGPSRRQAWPPRPSLSTCRRPMTAGGGRPFLGSCSWDAACEYPDVRSRWHAEEPLNVGPVPDTAAKEGSSWPRRARSSAAASTPTRSTRTGRSCPTAGRCRRRR